MLHVVGYHVDLKVNGLAGETGRKETTGET